MFTFIILYSFIASTLPTLAEFAEFAANEGIKDNASKHTPKTTESKKDDTKPAEKPDRKTVKAKKVVVNKKRIVLKKGKKVKLAFTFFNSLYNTVLCYFGNHLVRRLKGNFFCRIGWF